MSRTLKTIKNMSVGVISQVASLLVSFIMASLFARTLGGEYLGANSLFANVVAILAFSELGIGNAVAFSLYEPLHLKQWDRVSAIMNFFKKFYVIVGISIFLLSIVLTPFVHHFVKGQSIPHLGAYFFLYTLNTVVSYFLSYKRTLFIADQKSFVNDFNTMVTKVGIAIFQVGFLLLHSFLGFLIIQIVGTFISNLVISRRANRDYGHVFDNSHVQMNAFDKALIKNSTIGVIGQKIGGIIVLDTNNLLVSGFVGLFTTAIYTGYMTLLSGAQQIIIQLLNSMTASLGEINATHDNNKMELWLKRHAFLSWTVGFFSFVYFIAFATPFMKVWLGSRYSFGFSIVFWMALNFYIQQTRQTFLSFIQAQGLFGKVGTKSIVEAALNLALTLFFVMYLKMGVLGVVLGTTLVHFLLNIWFEPWVVYRFGFKKSLPTVYFLTYYLKMMYTVVVGIASYWISVNWIMQGNLAGRTLGFMSAIVLGIVTYVIVAVKDANFKFWYSFAMKLVNKIIGK